MSSIYRPQIAISRRAEELARSGDYRSWPEIEGDLQAVFSPSQLRREFESTALQEELDRLCRQPSADELAS
jgi:hypothetical protein